MSKWYDKGDGVAKDDEKAVYWYRKAADQGYARAQSNLGFMYRNGYGVAKDDKKARGCLYKIDKEGEGVRKKEEEAQD